MAWHVAGSLQTLLEQLNRIAPRRSKASDGSIGDAAHASRKSDHNPWYNNTVTARDFTHDPGGGLDCHKLAEVLVNRRDSRIKYIIWNRRIWQGSWKGYSGSNPHTKHLHLSVVANSSCESRNAWNLAGLVGGGGGGGGGGTSGPRVLKLTRPYMQGVDVLRLQLWANPRFHYAKLTPDGVFGPGCDRFVKEFQRRTGLGPDGQVGPRTYAKMRENGYK